nr:unnamed protein product [Callosobruchus chinensis]
MTSNDISEIEKTWSKVEYVSKKTGMREGLSDGKDTVFQSSFDRGFKEGFQNAYEIGKSKGIAMAKSKLSNGQQQVASQNEEKISIARCVICKDDELLNKNIDEIIQKQRRRFVDN